MEHAETAEGGVGQARTRKPRTYSVCERTGHDARPRRCREATGGQRKLWSTAASRRTIGSARRSWWRFCGCEAGCDRSAARLYNECFGAVDTHRNGLSVAKAFDAWCVAQGWLQANPFAAIKGRGRRKRGKPQLRIEEARIFMTCCPELAPRDDGTILALAYLLLGARAGEVVLRQVRDVDDGDRLLWIPDSKTEAGRRQLEVPNVPVSDALDEDAIADLALDPAMKVRGACDQHRPSQLPAMASRTCVPGVARGRVERSRREGKLTPPSERALRIARQRA